MSAARRAVDEPLRLRFPRLLLSDGLRLLAGGLGLAVAYFTVPLTVPELGATGKLLAAIGAVAALAWAVVGTVRRGATLSRLLVLLMTVVVVFSLVFFLLAQTSPGQFEGLETRVDALYFTLTTMTTTGYGDVHAVGQGARLAVSAVFVFDMLFLALLTTAVGRSVQDLSGRRGDDEG